MTQALSYSREDTFSLKPFSSSLRLSFWCKSNVVSTQALMAVCLKPGSWSSVLFPRQTRGRTSTAGLGEAQTSSSSWVGPGSAQVLNYFCQGEQGCSARSEPWQMGPRCFPHLAGGVEHQTLMGAEAICSQCWASVKSSLEILSEAQASGAVHHAWFRT